MEANAYEANEKQVFRSSFLNSVAGEFHKAAARNELHRNTLKLAEANYKGEMLQRVLQEENSQYSSDISSILQSIDSYAAGEQNRLESLKKAAVVGAASEKEIDFIARLDKIADIVTQEELQIMANAYKDSSIIQRKLKQVSDRRELYIDTYPGYDEKMEAAQQAAVDMKAFISSGDFGLTPTIYLEVQFKELDDLLVPVEKEADGYDNT